MPFEVLSYLPATMIIEPDLTSGACWPSEFVLVRLESQERYGVILTLGTHGGEEQRREGKQSQQVRNGRMIGWSVLVSCWRPTPDCSMMVMTVLM
jgi:hypothetical protein